MSDKLAQILPYIISACHSIIQHQNEFSQDWHTILTDTTPYRKEPWIQQGYELARVQDHVSAFLPEHNAVCSVGVLLGVRWNMTTEQSQ